MMRLLALCSLPRTDPGNASQYIRTNGRFELVMARSARPGLPYGTIPRIVLAWMCTDDLESTTTPNRPARASEPGWRDRR